MTQDLRVRFCDNISISCLYINLICIFWLVKNFLESNLNKGKKSSKYPLGVIEPTLATVIQENLSIPCRSDDTIRELTRGIRNHFTKFVKQLGSGLLEQAQLGLGHSYSRSKVTCCQHFILNLRFVHFEFCKFGGDSMVKYFNTCIWSHSKYLIFRVWWAQSTFTLNWEFQQRLNVFQFLFFRYLQYLYRLSFGLFSFI